MWVPVAECAFRRASSRLRTADDHRPDDEDDDRYQSRYRVPLRNLTGALTPEQACGGADRAGWRSHCFERTWGVAAVSPVPGVGMRIVTTGRGVMGGGGV